MNAMLPLLFLFGGVTVFVISTKRWPRSSSPTSA